MAQKEKKWITCDGNYAAAHIAYMFSEVAAIYPITPSSPMAEHVDEWSAKGRKNLFGDEVRVAEMQSEAGASGAVHGSLQGGALTTTFTASQGLLLMIPNMYKIAGELLPGVFHVSARTVATHALSIFGDHSDVYSVRQTGFAMLASGSVQQVMDLAGIAHLAAIKSRVPFLHFFDGFRTSHEIQKVEMLTEDDLRPLVDWEAIERFRKNALNPEHPVTRGTAQNPDIFFQARESVNRYYEAVPDIVEHYMQEISKITGREYHPFTYYGDPEAKYVVVAMGSVTETIREVVDHLNAQGEKVGLITVHLFRPFSKKYFFKVLPDTVERIAVLDRSKEPGAPGEPLYLDVVEAFYGRDNKPLVVGGRYGLSSKDTTPAHILAVYKNLMQSEPKNHFTISIIDDVTFTSLPLYPEIDLAPEGTFQAKFYGIGGDGTVGANKDSIKIIGDNTDKYAQAYFVYDSKKSGGITISHLRFGDRPIRSTYLVTTPDFVACHVPAYLEKFDLLKGLKKGGTFLLNTVWSKEETLEHLPNHVKKYLAENDINFYIINATKIAKEVGLGNRTSTALQAAFFKVSGVIPYEVAFESMKNAIIKKFSRKGEEIVNANIAAIERGGNEVIKVDVPAEWKNLPDDNEFGIKDENVPEFVRKVADPMNRLEGDNLPVSAFVDREDGTFPAGTTQFEKRKVAVEVPKYIPENCIQCNYCAYACPHAVIRPFLMTEEEAKEYEAKGGAVLRAIGPEFKGYSYTIAVSVDDCTGCGVCVEVCPGKKGNKALEMAPFTEEEEKQSLFDWLDKNVGYKSNLADTKKTVKNSQFARPLFEFHGACPGCGETPYIKLVTQLYGDHLTIANATGCSSIYGGSAPSTPYRAGDNGRGPAWANSLFEDNAEYGYGIAIAYKRIRERIARLMDKIVNGEFNDNLKEAAKLWLESQDTYEQSLKAAENIIPLLEKDGSDVAKELLLYKDYFTKKSVWIVGGDGWAYDIGYGGLDHVLASGENVNLLVLDTEVYSNTGGQTSKATPTGASAKFSFAGKPIRKKDLGALAMTYGYVYVASVAMGANFAQYLKAVREAESYDGPSLIVAYSTCIAHGLRDMSYAQHIMKDAVEAGAWILYRYDPRLAEQGKNPLQLDSKEPDFSKLRDWMLMQTRFSALKRTFPERAEELFKKAEEDARWRWNYYKHLASIDWSE